MLTRYIHEAMKRARYKTLANGDHFGQVPGLAGVWVNARTLDKCREELQEVLEEWLVLKIRDNDPIPRIGRVALPQRAAFRLHTLVDGLPDTELRAASFFVSELGEDEIIDAENATKLDLVRAEPGDDVPIEEVRRQLGL